MTVLVLDIGSSSTRALLFDNSAARIPDAAASRLHRFDTSSSGASTIDAHILKQNIETCIDEILQHPRAEDIQVVGVDTFVGNILGLDVNGQPVTPVFTYADTRSHEIATALRRLLDEDTIHQQTGCRLHTAYLPAQLKWLYETDEAESVAKWVDVATYLYSVWFGAEVPCSYSVASWSGLLNRKTLTWSPFWLEQLNLSEKTLSSLADYDAMCSGLAQEYANRWTHLRNVPFALAVGDGAAANVGSGCVDRSHIALTIGTTAAVRVADTVFPETLPSGLWHYRVTKDLSLLGGATTEGGNIVEWAKHTLILGSLDDIEQQLLQRDADSHGLTFLPFLGGERSPGWRSDATGILDGIRQSTMPIDIFQAALEGVALRLAAITRQLVSIASEDAVVIAGGGAVHASTIWTQIIANALNRRITVLTETEVTARGTAILALRAIEKLEIQPSLSIKQTFIPQPEQVKRLAAAYERQNELYNLHYPLRNSESK